MMHAQAAQQGHRYQLGNRQVLAMQSGHTVEVREINEDDAWPLGRREVVKASWMSALPMRYFHGQVPA